MPLSLDQAKKIVLENLPGGDIRASVSNQGLYIFRVFTAMPGEEQWDPFYSVNPETGEFKDFSILTDANPETVSLLAKAKE